jgi:hypothetical protein
MRAAGARTKCVRIDECACILKRSNHAAKVTKRDREIKAGERVEHSGEGKEQPPHLLSSLRAVLKVDRSLAYWTFFLYLDGFDKTSYVHSELKTTG